MEFSDTLGAVKVRLGIGRYDYLVVPGIYAVGNPEPGGDVFVSANYKLSFDTLRRSLAGRSGFILVLETMGINVWCAAGKETFGTSELVWRINQTGLSSIVDHRRLIVPQLGAPGISAHKVKAATGFKVLYGPINACDIPKFIEEGYTATKEMRTKSFPFMERLVLVPMELFPALKLAVVAVLILLLLSGLLGDGGFFLAMVSEGLIAGAAVFSAVIAGAVLGPLLLPWLPGRAFAIKGAISGLLFVLCAGLVVHVGFSGYDVALPKLAFLSMLVIGGASYFLMNFTGSSSYTSLSGVEKEMKMAVPVQIASVGIGGAGWAIVLLLT